MQCGNDAADVNEENEKLYNQLVHGTPYLRLLVNHEVMVNAGVGKGKRMHAGKQKEKFPHALHLLDIAVRLIQRCIILILSWVEGQCKTLI